MDPNTLPAADKRAVALVGLMIEMHGKGDGDGLFSGPGRYGILHQRLVLAAEVSRSVAQWWDRACASLKWHVGPMDRDTAILALLAHQDDDAEVLRCIAERGQVVIMLARQIARVARIKQRDLLSTAQDPEPINDPIPFGDPLDIFDRNPADEAAQ